jgi:tryptophan-rich sensory protein
MDTLYIMMGIAAGLVWDRMDSDKEAKALILFAIQLALNALWSYLFFGLRNPISRAGNYCSVVDDL